MRRALFEELDDVRRLVAAGDQGGALNVSRPRADGPPAPWIVGNIKTVMLAVKSGLRRNSVLSKKH